MYPANISVLANTNAGDVKNDDDILMLTIMLMLVLVSDANANADFKSSKHQG